jgi:hypothetical protein
MTSTIFATISNKTSLILDSPVRPRQCYMTLCLRIIHPPQPLALPQAELPHSPLSNSAMALLIHYDLILYQEGSFCCDDTKWVQLILLANGFVTTENE